MQRIQQTKHALGSTAYLTIVLEDNASPTEVFSSSWQEIDGFERQFSRFLTDSELSKFNLQAGSRQTVSQAFLRLLTSAKKMGELTDGLYNPLILPSLQRAGYKGSWPRPEIAVAKLDFEARNNAQWSEIEMGDNWAFIPENTALDFGGIGKGYLLDQLARNLKKMGVDNYWLSLGGDILCAGYDVNGDPWRVAIQHAKIEGRSVAAVKNAGKKLAVATSGITKRQGFSENGAWHHIIDPRSGKPAVTDLLTSSVCTDKATLADVAAKCLVIVGSHAAGQTMRKIGVTNAVLQLTHNAEISVEKVGTIWSA